MKLMGGGERLNFNSASKVGPEEGCGASDEMSQSFYRPGQDLGERGKWESGFQVKTSYE